MAISYPLWLQLATIRKLGGYALLVVMSGKLALSIERMVIAAPNAPIRKNERSEDANRYIFASTSKLDQNTEFMFSIRLNWSELW